MDEKKLALELEEDLILLRKNHGFTLLRYNNLATLPNIICNKNQSFSESKSYFISCLNEISDKQATKALLVAYGLDKDYEEVHLLSQRRRDYSIDIGIHAETLLECENYGIKELVKIIIKKHQKN